MSLILSVQCQLKEAYETSSVCLEVFLAVDIQSTEQNALNLFYKVVWHFLRNIHKQNIFLY